MEDVLGTKKLYVINLVETSNRKRIYAENSTRLISNFYFLKLNSNRIPVCQKMFLSTLGITQKMVRIWKESSGLHCTPAISEKQNKVPNNCKKSYDDRLNFLKKWLDGIPKLESHYRRRYSKKLYFEADFKSYRQIYDLYIEECRHQKENEISQVSFPKFMDVLKAGNYGLFKPRNDECDLCVSFKSKNVSKDEYENHRSEIEKMRNEKLNDIENARSGLCLLFCIDMQAVKLVPQTNANSSYYKMKLQVHNFTVYNVITHESDNYIWDETEGALTSSYFATCIIKHLEKVISQSPEFHHIIIYSDGCCYQNRNAILANALLLFCTEKNVTIEQKYLVVGHTQMECDATHSLIERKLKNIQVNLPSQLVDIIKSARKTPFPLNAHLLNHAYFCNYDAIPKRYTSIRPGKNSINKSILMKFP